MIVASMKNEVFEIEIHRMTGGIERLIRAEDPRFFNWTRGRFGIPGGMNFLDKTEINGDCITQTYAFFSYLDLIVKRSLEPDGLREKYIFKNTGNEPMAFEQGELGIYATFADSTDIAEVALARRAVSHVFAGGDTAYIFNAALDGGEAGVGLVLTKGSLVESVYENATSTFKGDILLKLPAFKLDSGDSYELEWLVFPYNSRKEFFEIIGREGALVLELDSYYAAKGDEITIKADAEKAVLHGKEYEFSEGSVNVPATHEGEQNIELFYDGGRRTFAKVFVGARKAPGMAEILGAHGVRKPFSKRHSAQPLIESIKNLDWYQKIGDKGYLALSCVELFRYYRIYKGERLADIGIPLAVIKESEELQSHFHNQVINALSYSGVHYLYNEAATLDMLLKAYSLWQEEGYLAAAKNRAQRLRAFVGIQPDYLAFNRAGLMRNDCQCDSDIFELIDAFHLCGKNCTLGEYFGAGALV